MTRDGITEAYKRRLQYYRDMRDEDLAAIVGRIACDIYDVEDSTALEEAATRLEEAARSHKDGE